jgi:catechol 2,3-dioxygenase-like lactoylglutathione lyase family enzyme
MAVGKLRSIVINVTDLERGERFWSELTGLPLAVSGVGFPTLYSRLGHVDTQGRPYQPGTPITDSGAILLQLVPEENHAPSNNAHPDLTVEDVDMAVEQALELGATTLREKGTYPLSSPDPYLEWAVLADPFGNAFCLIKDLVAHDDFVKLTERESKDRTG